MINLPRLHSGVSLDRKSLHDLRFTELATALSRDGLSPHHAKALWRAIQRDAATDLEQYSFLPPLKRWVVDFVGPGKSYYLDFPAVVSETRSSDGLTRKFLLRLDDGQTIETVLMAYRGRHTVCVSTQAGCAMGCVFCATGQMGFSRNLRCGEIVAQVMHARRVLRSIDPTQRIRNMVLMGMGEPLNNYDSVMRALESLSDVRGAGIGPTRISISTVGIIPAILRLAEERQPYCLAVSLHGSTEEERSALVPASKKWPLAELIATCRNYCDLTGKRVFFEWTLIDGKNDSTGTAERLANLLKGMDAHVNLIPLNPTGGFDGAESRQGREFQKILVNSGIPCTFRQRRGIDVQAGCGMLQAERLNKPALYPVL